MMKAKENKPRTNAPASLQLRIMELRKGAVAGAFGLKSAAIAAFMGEYMEAARLLRHAASIADSLAARLRKYADEADTLSAEDKAPWDE